MPAFREEHRIADTVRALRAALTPLQEPESAEGPAGLEIVVVDDGSRDATAAHAQAGGADAVIRLPVNRGKGAAVRAGVLAASGATVAFTDADLSYAPAQLMRLVHAVEEGWDMVVGSRRHIDTTTLVGAARYREVSGRAFNVLTRLVLAERHGDTQCGLKAFSADAARSLFSLGRLDGFAFDVELFLLAERRGLRVREVPVELTSAQSSTVRVSRDALRMVGDLVRLRRWARAGVYDGPDGVHDATKGAYGAGH